jgi:hypothetical protein
MRQKWFAALASIATVAAILPTSASAAGLVIGDNQGGPPKGYVGQSYNFGMYAVPSEGCRCDAPPPVTWQLTGSIPPGLSFTSNTGGNATVSGTPQQAGASEFDVTATDGAGNTASHHYKITIDQIDTTGVDQTVTLVSRLGGYAVWTLQRFLPCPLTILNPILTGRPSGC